MRVFRVLFDLITIIVLAAVLTALAVGLFPKDASGEVNKFSLTGETKHINLQLHNTISLRGDVTSDSVSKIIDAISRNENKIIYFVIDSPGGSVDDGLKLIDVMKGSKKKFICVATAAASMAFSILQACDVRLITQNSILMQHLVSYGIFGDERRNSSFVKLVQRQAAALHKQDYTRLGLSKEEFDAKIQKDWWLFGSDAVKANAADGIVNVSCSKSLSDYRSSEITSFIFATVTVVKAGCPLVGDPLSVTIDIKEGGRTPKSELEVRRFVDSVYPRKKLFRARDSP